MNDHPDMKLFAAHKLVPQVLPGYIIVAGLPPNHAEIVAVFPAAAAPDTIFTYGATIYNNGPPLTHALIAHERVHVSQQTRFEGGPAAWWARYLTDPAWRFLQELDAHKVEHDVLCHGRPRHERKHYLTQVAKRLSGPLYGHAVRLEEAKRLLKGKSVDLTREKV